LPNTKPVGVIPKERKVLFLSAQFHRESGDETERKIDDTKNFSASISDWKIILFNLTCNFLIK
jgi:hypothetical protein